MAKRKTSGETTVTRAAVSIGTALGRAAAKFDEWLEQRDAIARELTSVIGKAQGMLTSIAKPAPTKKAARALKTTRAARPVRVRRTASAGQARKTAAAARRSPSKRTAKKAR